MAQGNWFKNFVARIGKGWLITIGVIVVLLIAIRIALPPVATKYANDYLDNKLPGYRGHVEGIHFSFFRGAYNVSGFDLNKIDSATHQETEFASVENIDLSLEWSALFHGKIVGKLFFETPVVKFTKDKVEPKTVVKDTTTFRQLLDVGMPIDVDRVEITNGAVHYKDLTSEPPLDLNIHNIYVLAENLRNTTDPTQEMPSSVVLNASVYGGAINVQTHLNLLADQPTFAVKAEVKNLNLPDLNNFFKAYGKFTVDKGNFSVYSEILAKNGRFNGYVKPLLVDLRVIGPSNKDENVLTKLWEGVLDGVNWVFKNKNKDQLGTKIPLEGEIKDPKPNILYTIFALLRNGWIQALNPSLDYGINIQALGSKDQRSPGQKLNDKMKQRKEHAKNVKEEKKQDTAKGKKKKLFGKKEKNE